MLLVMALFCSGRHPRCGHQRRAGAHNPALTRMVADPVTVGAHWLDLRIRILTYRRRAGVAGHVTAPRDSDRRGERASDGRELDRAAVHNRRGPPMVVSCTRRMVRCEEATVAQPALRRAV